MSPGGVVNARHEAAVRLRVRGPTGVEVDAETIVDTAFNGWLTLPAATAVYLQLPKRTTGNAKMGDGSAREFDVFSAEVLWSDGWRTVSAAAIGREALVGMRLLSGSRLTIDVAPGGEVAITPLSP